MKTIIEKKGEEMEGKVEKLHREILDYYGLLEHESICEIRHFGTGEETVSYTHLTLPTN